MSMAHNLQQHAKRFLPYSSRIRRFFCSDITKPYGLRTNLTLQDRIESALEQKAGITTVLEQWRQQQGHRLNPSLVRGVFVKLCTSLQPHHALEVSDWMIKHKICNLTPEDYTDRFHLIENVLGFQEAENFFESIPENLRGESIYNSLLRNYAKRSGINDLDRAEFNFKKMRELGLLVRLSPYSSMVSLYTSFRIRHRVDEILKEMKESNIKLDSVTVNNALRVYASESDVEAMDKFLDDWKETVTLEFLTMLDMAKAYLRAGDKGKAKVMLRKTEKFMEDPKSYVELMRLYGEAGVRDGVYRIWDLYKKKTKDKNSEGFQALFGSLLKLDDINGAEEVYYKEWLSSGLELDVRILTMLVSGFREKGMVEKADKLMNRTMVNKVSVRSMTMLLEEWEKKENQVKPLDARNLIKDLSDSNQLRKALEASSWMCDKRLFNIFSQDYATRLHLIDKVLGLEEAEKFFESNIPENMKDYSVYDTLLSCYARSNKTLNKAEDVFEKMRELGFLSKISPFNSMISLYSEQGKRSKVMQLLSKIKETNIEPDSVTMNNVLRVNAYVSALGSMEKCKSEWDGDEKMKLEVRTRYAMAEAYERAGQLLKAIEITASRRKVYGLWKEYKKKATYDSKRDGVKFCRNEGYRSVISSLLRLGDLQGAEKVYREWDQSGGGEFDGRIPGLLISRYCEEGDEMKVREVMNSSSKKLRGLKFKTTKQVLGVACLVSISGLLATVVLA